MIINTKEICKCGHPKQEHLRDGECISPLDQKDWSHGYCECKHYEPSEAGELLFLRNQYIEFQEFLKKLDECFSTCDNCGGVGQWEEGPYTTDCPTCLGRGEKLNDYRKLYILHDYCWSLLYEKKQEEE